MADFAGLRVLMVEDEGAVALLIEDMLIDLGCEMTASAADLERACKLARTAEVDLALLDLNLQGLSAIPVAHILRERGIPFIFSTGYGAGGIVQEFASCPVLVKPFVFSELQQKMKLALAPAP